MIEPVPDRLRRGLLLAPFIFVAHWLEEGPGFVFWLNAHVKEGITQGLFHTVNAAGLVITVLLVLGFWVTQSPASVFLVTAWLSFLMLANAALHITGAIVDRAYVPGLATAILLYVPYCLWVGVQIARGRRTPIGSAAAAVVLGGLPMAVHGYRILFLGSRLF